MSPDQKNLASEVAHLKKIAEFMDSKFRLPGGFRIGLDGIIGFIPGLGDLIANSVSFYILYQAAVIGCPPSVIIRMGFNVLLDNLIDTIPILGNFFDIFWKANNRNVALVETYVANPRKTTLASRFAIAAALSVVAVTLILSLTLVVFVAIWAWDQFSLLINSTN